jgi:peptide/nickel transport system substrate-binding protein
LREAWFNTQDLAEQKQIGADIQLQAFQSVPYWPLGIARIPMALRQGFTGVLEASQSSGTLRRA